MALTSLFVFLIVFAVLAGIANNASKNPKYIGNIGEAKVRRILAQLPNEAYIVLNDIMLRFNGETAQIDHIVVSDYGVFVIETKNYHGHLYGREAERYWTQKIGGQSNRLYNPILQNSKHLKVLCSVLNESPLLFHNIVVLGNNVDLSIQPQNSIVRLKHLRQSLLGYKSPTLSSEQVRELAARIRQLNVTDKSEREQHVNRVKGYKNSRKPKSQKIVPLDSKRSPKV